MMDRNDIPDPERRALLVGHARFILRTARIFKTPLLRQPDLPDIRAIECDLGSVWFQMMYSYINGTVLTVRIHPEFNGATNPVLETKEHDFEPIRSRIRKWQRQLILLKQTETVDFRQASLIHALLHGFRS